MAEIRRIEADAMIVMSQGGHTSEKPKSNDDEKKAPETQSRLQRPPPRPKHRRNTSPECGMKYWSFAGMACLDSFMIRMTLMLHTPGDAMYTTHTPGDAMYTHTPGDAMPPA